jgi:hypothetical protein
MNIDSLQCFGDLNIDSLHCFGDLNIDSLHCELGCSVSIVCDYELDGWGLIPDRGR